MDSNIDTLLQKWNETKSKIKELETKCEKYKKLCGEIMDERNSDVIDRHIFILNRRIVTKATISRLDVPSDIWDEYSKKTTYPSYFLTKKV